MLQNSPTLCLLVLVTMFADVWFPSVYSTVHYKNKQGGTMVQIWSDGITWCFTYHGISMVLKCTWENTVVLTWFCEIHPFCLDSPQTLICILFKHCVLFFVFLFLLSAHSNAFLLPSRLFCAVWDELAFALGCTSLSEPVIKRILPDTWPITTTLMFHLPTARTIVSLWWRKTSAATVAAHSA